MANAHLNPCFAVLRLELEKLLVQRAAAIELAQFDLELNVALIETRLRTLAERRAEDLPRARHLLLAHLEHRELQPDLRERELLVRNHLHNGQRNRSRKEDTIRIK